MGKRRLLKKILWPIPDFKKLVYWPSRGWGLIRQTLRRPKPAAGIPEPFAEACRRHHVSDYRLQTEIIPALRRLRRTATVMGWCNIGLFGIGLVTLHVNMIVIAALAAVLCFTYAFRWQFHGWQCHRRELAGINEFLGDSQAFFQIFLW